MLTSDNSIFPFALDAYGKHQEVVGYLRGPVLDTYTSDAMEWLLVTKHDPGLIQLLESHCDELGLMYYSISLTTIDEVFPCVIYEGEEEEEGEESDRQVKVWIKVVDT
ncbi:hypothetical protein T440DRAFT_464655 [Plenodomus tracheiphilus IPT5]|uniref:Uncharacterized protein n=1 Tax=Plenodomus tracheiphilus IPT5 TaxID=1408161 RepID=A0A6A7BJA8_9PLEO|nr:hypothetical protein T440DRAFT_464655 [Plenodomus tracheiphilus IPT5]